MIRACKGTFLSAYHIVARKLFENLIKICKETRTGPCRKIFFEQQPSNFGVTDLRHRILSWHIIRKIEHSENEITTYFENEVGPGVLQYVLYLRHSCSAHVYRTLGVILFSSRLDYVIILFFECSISIYNGPE